MFVVCKFDYRNGFPFICKVEDVDRGIEIANALMTSRFDEFAVYTEEDFEKLKMADNYIEILMLPCEYITGQEGFERNC